jgi:hypothetical protein
MRITKYSFLATLTLPVMFVVLSLLSSNIHTAQASKTEPEQSQAYILGAQSDNQTDIYMVNFPTRIPEYKNKVLSVKGVTYIEDLIVEEGPPPAIIIRATPEAISEIKKLDFVIGVWPYEPSQPLPKFRLHPIELIARIIMRLAIPISLAVAMILLIVLLIYLKKKRSKRT